ncbi:DUF6456 domain-containing protein [Bosea sp. TND4EK4]|uniref:DUF6456 domain-containing protein n=1 Tax=Bosea sp. TND4EK4 TaxID=1907408 RepID=UPI000954511B|nr:DUF6456 domain-containing protein [Bosea sp. TND4EK4]SIQ05204.1 hypothetical protein SAMN05880592_101718 [Bosea sp. TND4EK4]
MSDETTDRDQQRLLRHLSEPHAYAIRSPLDCGRIALYRGDGGTSLGAGYVAGAAAEALVARGLLAWSSAGRAARLVPASAADNPRPTEPPAARPGYNDRESPLLWLHRRPGKDGQPQISAEEFAAGERFRADLTRAQMLPRTTMNWDAALTPGERGAGPHDHGGASDSALAARQRVRKACDRLGPELSGIAIDVCGFLKGLDWVERERNWPARSAKVVLRVALAALATHYGLDRKGRAPAISAWRDPDARPGIMPAGRL